MRGYYLGPVTPIDLEPIVPLRIVARSYHESRCSTVQQFGRKLKVRAEDEHIAFRLLF